MFEGRTMYWGTREKPVQEIIDDALATDNPAVAMDFVDYLMNFALDCDRQERLYIRTVCNKIRANCGRRPFLAAPASPANLPSAAPQTDDKNNKVPARLREPDAEEIWQQLRDRGFIQPKGYQLAAGVSNNQATYIADCFIQLLETDFKWKPFEELWDIRHMAQNARNWQETGRMPPGNEDIRDCFE